MGAGRRMTYEELCNAVLPVSSVCLHDALSVWNLEFTSLIFQADASNVFWLINLCSTGKT